ncbi:MAG TPA: YCF48-related protein, partial [Blastocatellia bacterium]|nr:YCF48-related protein [Blastocatellia bacterium]
MLVVAQTGGAASAHRANPLGVHFNHTSEDPAALTSCDLLAKSAALAAKGPLWNWHTTGPNGGIVFSIASDPSTPGTLYAATLERGVYKTVDGGGHWIHVGPDHTDVYCVAVDPHRPNVVYAGAYNHGVLKSVDRGASWTVSSLGIGTPIIYSLAVDPTDSNIVYAGGSFALYRSTDAGAAWREVALPVVVATCSAITIDPTDARTIYVGGTASAILKTTDGGATWQLFGDGAGLHEAILNGIAIDVADHNLVYAATVDGIYRSVNGGATWELRGDTIVFRAIVADRVRPGVAYAAAESGGVLVTTNRGDTWEPLDAGLTTPVTLALAVDASTPGNLFVGTGGRCVFRRASAGGPWELTDEGFDALSVYAVVVDPSAPGVAYAASFGGVFKSTDAGETWRYVGLDYVRSIAIDP